MIPKLVKPTFHVMVPSTKKPVLLQMMTRRDEKVLLVAKTSSEPADWLAAIKQVVKSCCVDQNVDIEKLASFDLEFLFLRLRSQSIGSKETLTYHDHSDEKDYSIEIDLENIAVVFPDGADNDIQVDDKTTLQLRWPTAQTWSDASILKATDPEAALDELVASCVDKIWIENQVYDANQVSRDEVKSFMDMLDIKAWEKIRNFIGHTPHLSHWVEWTNTKGEERRFELTTLSDFFSLGLMG